MRYRFLYLALIVLALLAPRAAEASTYRWLNPVSGNWNDPANWTLIEGPAGAGYPNGSGDTAHLWVSPVITVTIPDGVTITVEHISFVTSFGVTITGTGSGLLVLDSADGQVEISAVNTGSPIIDVPIQLKANLVLSTMMPMTFSRGISEDGTSRSVTISEASSGTFRFTGPFSNTYTGATTLRRGRLELGRTNGAVAIAGPLVIDPIDDDIPATEVRLLTAENVADNAPVRVTYAGFLGVGFNVNNLTETVGDLTIADRGLVALGDGATGRLAVSSLTMENGHLRTGAAGSQVVLNGNVTAVNGVIEGAGSLALNGATRVFTIGQPPQTGGATGLFVDVHVTGAAGLVKDGPGQLFLRASNDYTGDTVVLDGELVVDADNAATSVTLQDGVLRGGGGVGAVTATGGTIWPGPGPGLGTGAITLSPGVTLKGSPTSRC